MTETAVAGLNMKLVEIATAYQRSRVLCAAARLGVADALKAVANTCSHGRRRAISAGSLCPHEPG